MHFDLITVPGKLIYTGDMGTYVFERLDDMFEFFRPDQREPGELKINKGYWAEKLIAQSCHGRHVEGVRIFSADCFKENVVRWIRESGSDGRSALLREVRERVFSLLDDPTGVRVMDALYEFEHNGFRFYDCWEMDSTEWDTRFVWCCYALTWGIEQYDKAHPEPKP